VARLIVKSPYIKGGGKGGYAKYIATRDGVELLPSGYMEYMAQRPRSHGLFGDQDAVDLTSAIREINEYPGNIWTHIISLKREDAERLGYDHAPQWRNLLRTHRNDIATAMHIPPQDFRWYAAFHDEGDHPHVHMMVWSVKPGQAYLSREGIQKIKFVLTNDIFQQEMLHTYEQKSASRDELVRESRRVMEELTRQMEDGICDSPEMELLMQTLVIQLETAKGKKKYGYLPPKTKETVRRIVDQLELLSVVNKCYQTWWELQCEIEDYYTERQRERPKLSEQKEFRSILNAVIQEADNIRLGVVTFEDREMNDEVEEEELNDEPQNLWQLVMAYQEARAVLYDEDAGWSEQEEAVQTLELLWNEGLTVAAHQLGKCYRDGLAVIPDDEQAEAWFLCSAQAGKDYSQYALGKLLQEQRRIIEAVEWYNQASAQGNQYADYRLGKFYLTGKEIPKDVAEAIRHLTASAEAGNQYAKYTLGKLYLMGQDIPQDREQAFYWFTQSAEQGNEYAQFFLDRWDTTGSPSVMLSVTRLLHRIAQTFREAPSPRDATTIQPHMDRKRLEQLREKKLAMGHRLDDYGSYDFTMGGMSM
jgi:TPR repeat protein